MILKHYLHVPNVIPNYIISNYGSILSMIFNQILSGLHTLKQFCHRVSVGIPIKPMTLKIRDTTFLVSKIIW